MRGRRDGRGRRKGKEGTAKVKVFTVFSGRATRVEFKNVFFVGRLIVGEDSEASRVRGGAVGMSATRWRKSLSWGQWY